MNAQTLRPLALRAVWDPLGAGQTRAMYELQALAYALWLSARNGICLREAQSWRPLWTLGFISSIEFYRDSGKQAHKVNLIAAVEIPNADPAVQVCVCA